MTLGGVLTVAAGVAMGVIIAPLVGLTEDVAEGIYDKAFPVIDARAEIINKAPSGWLVLMHSEKHRDCRLLEVQAYDVAPSKEVQRLHFAREDGQQPKQMPPGNFRSSNYIVLPPPKHQLVISFMHECSGRTVRTPVAIKE